MEGAGEARGDRKDSRRRALTLFPCLRRGFYPFPALEVGEVTRTEARMTRLAGIAWFAVAVWLTLGVWRIGNMSLIQLVTPRETRVINKTYAGLPPVMEAPTK